MRKDASCEWGVREWGAQALLTASDPGQRRRGSQMSTPVCGLFTEAIRGKEGRQGFSEQCAQNLQRQRGPGQWLCYGPF
ncbi:hypothetical protein AAFF_G00351920 [Aldrovandia affinis]|uniref:Uncharacterized protein n=1 Tax=Aldrovandia affinis TaxID=143900 RepID=A0AAD7SJB6_9TELE|nr:hypothetical protein AAFF_G00351920 [Aldrovandia affinis]